MIQLRKISYFLPTLYNGDLRFDAGSEQSVMLSMFYQIRFLTRYLTIAIWRHVTSNLTIGDWFAQ